MQKIYVNVILWGMERIFSHDQIETSSGLLQEASHNSGVVFNREPDVLHFPAFDEILYIAQGDTTHAPDHVVLPKQSVALKTFTGATVVSGIVTGGQNVYLPGKVLPNGKLGLLTGRASHRGKEGIRKALDAMETMLLSKFYVEQLADVEHEEGANGVNAAKIGLGVIIAAAKSPVGLHGTVHDFNGYSENGVTNFATKLLKNQSTNDFTIPLASADYDVGFSVIDPEKTAGVIACKQHQFSAPLIGGSTFELTAGLTHTIRSMQNRAPDLHRNTGALLEPLT